MDPCEFLEKDRCTAEEILAGVHDLHASHQRLANIVKTYYQSIVGIRDSQKRIESRLGAIEEKLDQLLAQGA